MIPFFLTISLVKIFPHVAVHTKKAGTAFGHYWHTKFLSKGKRYPLWAMVFSLFGIHWVMPKKVVELLACWQGKFGRHRNGAIWMVVPHCLMRCICRERNNQISKRKIPDLKLFFFKTLLDWLSLVDNHSCNLCF